MQTAEKDGPVFPVLIYDSSGSLCHVGIINTKGYNKSLENGLPWVLDGVTGRLLPLADHNSAFAEALVAAGRVVNARCLASIEHTGGVAVARLDLALEMKIKTEPSRAEASNSPKAGTTSLAVTTQKQYGEPERLELANFLFKLQEVIRQRQVDLPEGSYTTHLFKSGTGKIRKKTGEEAIELILANDPAEIAAEASDLIYHMMVLFADTGVSLEQVLEELKKR